MHSNDLNVLRIFDQRFYKYANTTTSKLNYGIDNTKKYPLRAVIFPRIPSIVYKDGEWTGPDWMTLQLFAEHMNFTLDLTIMSNNTVFGRFVVAWTNRFQFFIKKGKKEIPIIT